MNFSQVSIGCTSPSLSRLINKKYEVSPVRRAMLQSDQINNHHLGQCQSSRICINIAKKPFSSRDNRKKLLSSCEIWQKTMKRKKITFYWLFKEPCHTIFGLGLLVT